MQQLFNVFAFAIIATVIFVMITKCIEKEDDLSKFDSVPNRAVPVQIYREGELDTIINYSVVVVNDSVVMFDSLGIKIVGYNKN